MDDLISRRAAIDAIMADKINGNALNIIIALGDGKQAETFNEACNRHAQLLDELPSARPENKTSDLISREEAIRIASGYCHPANITNELRKLPSVQPEQKRGKWLFCTSTEDLMCSNCLHYWIPNGGQYDYHYCPNCGARMDGGDADG